jgi:CBS domain-containing protein
MDAYFAKIQAAATEQARSAGVTLQTAVRAGHAAQTIIHFADEGGFDVIVIGADGRRGLGSTADTVTERSPCSVLVARVQPLSIRVKDVMSTDVATVNPTTPLAQVVELLIQRGVKAAPVVEAGRVVGVITGGDLLQRAGMDLRLSLQRALPRETMDEQLQQLAAQGQTAAEVMSTPAITVQDNAKLSEVAQLMADKHLKRLPVVDAQGGLVGLVSRLDVLATAASSVQAGETLSILPVGALHTAGDVMFRDVPTVNPDAPLNEVLNKLVATPLRRVVVVDEDRHVLGLIVDADLLAQVNPREKPGVFRTLIARLSLAAAEVPAMSGRAADVMRRELFAVHENTPLTEVVQMLVEKRVKRLIVTDASGRLVGMVDRQSLLRVIGREE